MGFFRQFFMLLDKAIFGLLDDAYNLIYSLSGVFVNNDIAKKVITNLYVIVGIFAFFKIALLLINSIINPEKLNEKGHGLSNILIRTVIMLVLLLFTPMLFQMGYDLQAKIVGWEIDEKGNLVTDDKGRAKVSNNGNIIEKLILGESAATASSGDDMTPGEKFGSIALSALVTVNENYVDEFIATGDYVGYKPKSEQDGGCQTQLCADAINAWNQMYANGKMEIDLLSYYINTSEKIKVETSGTTRMEKVYVYDYTIVLSTFVAGFIVYVLFSFALDIAARVFQLATLEIVSPLFIVTFIDPKSSSGGTFNRWLKEVGSTYASLFIRLACISLLLLFTSILNSLPWVENGDGYRWTKLTLLLGALLFAKKAPKWISELIGLKSDGLGGLGIGKKLAGAALIGGGIAAARKAIGNGAKKAGKKALDNSKKRVKNAADRSLGAYTYAREARKLAKEGKLTDENGNALPKNRKTYSQMAKAARERIKAEQMKNPENDFRLFKGIRDKYAENAEKINPEYKSKKSEKIANANVKAQASLKALGLDDISMGDKRKKAKDLALRRDLYGADNTSEDKVAYPINSEQMNNSFTRFFGGRKPVNDDEIHLAAYAASIGATGINSDGDIMRNGEVLVSNKDVSKKVNDFVDSANPYLKQLWTTTAYENNVQTQNEFENVSKNVDNSNKKLREAIVQRSQFILNNPEPAKGTEEHTNWEKELEVFEDNVTKATTVYEEYKKSKDELVTAYKKSSGIGEDGIIHKEPGDKIGTIQVDGKYINKYGEFKVLGDGKYEFVQKDMSDYYDLITQKMDDKLNGAKFKGKLESIKEEYSIESKKIDNN